MHGQNGKDSIRAPISGCNKGAGEKEKSQWLGETKGIKEEALARGGASTAFLAHPSSAPRFYHNPL